ncbi:class I glutamine amidotransferase-like protein [Gonapodya prolifera JEL478]|uniref:Class I glutamine amidotransferase-like protein n=1 Tax=Gonapodya prolifera (strain JEL478) TaxID=1344416 RepID=A0A139AG27_GONPJ|nr:class I glutamine amidotransferase-like protein [Gonapodya prolifera JEL478]|eukprot:KXS15747.1 class I glutamine amidotransferase-like protein [Gonapodya prolifera JEL478]
MTVSSVASQESPLRESSQQGANGAVRPADRNGTALDVGHGDSAPNVVRIAILECDPLTPEEERVVGRPIDWFSRLFRESSAKHLPHHTISFSFDTFQTCIRGALPSPDQVPSYNACIITGSRANAFDTDPWIQDLKKFIRDNHERTRFVGVCFGHQVIAEAFGGKVGRMVGGWEIGRAEVKPVGELGSQVWGRDQLALLYAHQDHVELTPPGFSVLLSNDRAPDHAQILGDRCLSVQAHPEYLAAQVAPIIDHLTSGDHGLDAAAASAARAGMGLPVDDLYVGAKMVGFILDGRKGMEAV